MSTTSFSTQPRETVSARGGRRITVGIRTVQQDIAPLRWALFEARPGLDVVEIAHAYPASCIPQGTAAHTMSRDGALLRAWQAVAGSVQRASKQRPGLEVVGTPLPGSPLDVLLLRARAADVLVVGDDEAQHSHRVARHLQRLAPCPTVCVPNGHDGRADVRPVTIVGDRNGFAPAALRFAAEHAELHEVGLTVAVAWCTLHPDEEPHPLAIAVTQAELDAELSDLRAEYPEVAVVIRVDLDDAWLRRVREHSSLVVLGREEAGDLGLVPPLPVPPAPVAFVPDAWLGRRSPG